jgi:hypothetical protein
MNRGKLSRLLPALLFGASVMTACSDPASPGPGGPGSISRQIGEGEEVCQTLDFSGFSHNDEITNQLSLFGTTLTVTAYAHTDPNGSVASTARIYDGNHNGGPDWDLEAGGLDNPLGECSDCATLGNMLIIQYPGETEANDNPLGGLLTISGFSSGMYVKSFTLVDKDADEKQVELYVDGSGVNIAGTQIDAGAAGQTVTTTEVREIGTEGIQFLAGSQADGTTPNGSFAVDNIMVCMRQPTEGDEGCTPGYWKNHTSKWSGYTTSQTLGSVFTIPSALGSTYSNTTLLNALSFNGGSGVAGAARTLARAAVAALLNAANSDVDYPRTTSEIIADVNAALASNDRATILALATELDDDNNLGCPLN